MLNKLPGSLAIHILRVIGTALLGDSGSVPCGVSVKLLVRAAAAPAQSLCHPHPPDCWQELQFPATGAS